LNPGFESQESKKLKPENGGSTPKLSWEQSQKFIEHLRGHIYLYVKEIIAYVQSTMNIIYTIPGMRDWLKRNSFSYKKPAIVPGKANAELQKKWINEYHQLKQNLPKDTAIFFMDGVHPTHNIQPAYGWIQTGVRKEISANNGRSRINLSGAIDIINYKLVTQ
jgi:hypothetical protein